MHGALNATVPLTWGLDARWAWQARAGIFGVIAVLVNRDKGQTMVAIVIADRGRGWTGAVADEAPGAMT